ncbi:MAG: hypothetical protein K8L91_31290 [Anaerolineae bacterium]|nr:hypothetical protein [Anaerolineae bacterium]
MGLDDELKRLQIECIEKELALIELEAQVAELENDLSDLKTRYDGLIVPLEKKLASTEEAIQELERQRMVNKLGDYNPLESSWRPPEGYVSVADQFERAWNKSSEPPLISPIKSTLTSQEDATKLKKLYRQLASRFHPDLTTDPDERQRRHAIMARINEAYAQKDYDGLMVLSKQADVTPDTPLEALKIQELRQLRNQLNERIEYLNSRRISLMHSDLMDLKLEAQLAAKVGRDLLMEMAAQLKQDLQVAQAKLAKLQREVR